MPESEIWPSLPWEDWVDTCDTLHLWMQIVGKVKLALAPFLNEWWEVGFQVTARGMNTGLIPIDQRAFEVSFDFIQHSLLITTSDDQLKKMALVPRSVSEFYAEFMENLRALGIDVTIDPMPTEMPLSTPLDQDRAHASYDAEYVHRWWLILVQTVKVMQRHRSSFVGKSSPILFYWGSFDLNEARYSGRPAPLVQGPRFFQLAEDQESVACGFWPGNANAMGTTIGAPAFYSYTNPMPESFQQAQVRPSEAYFDSRLGEFVLRYDDARRCESPQQTILDFFQSAYEAGATLAKWNRDWLESSPKP